MDYKDALSYLDSFVNYETFPDYSYNASFNLKRMERLLEPFGNPHERFRSIHIAGTKGKGSCAAMVASILKEAGLRVGLYTSPHLVSPRERIRVFDKFKVQNLKFKIGGQEIEGAIPEEDLCQLIEEIEPTVEKRRRSSDLGEISFFEIYTLLAFLYFAQNGVDFAVLEVGMGGRLDATNVVRPLVSVITPISYDHTDKLGNTLGAIAKEKAGIVKENSSVVISPQEDEAYAVIREVCHQKNCRLYEVGKDILFEVIEQDRSGEVFNFWGRFGEHSFLKTPLLGRHQVVNAALAIGAVELLRDYDLVVSSQQVRDGLAETVWPGRLQVIEQLPWIVLDGAQNRASARALKESIEEIFPYHNLILVFGSSSNKDIRGIGEELCPISNEVILTRAQSPRAARPEAIREEIEGLPPKITLTDGVEEAIALARQRASEEDLVLVAGSLYVVGEVMKVAALSYA